MVTPVVLVQSLLCMAGMEKKPESLGVGMSTRLIAGGAAGVTAASLTYPLDLVRTRLAAQASIIVVKSINHVI